MLINVGTDMVDGCVRWQLSWRWWIEVVPDVCRKLHSDRD